MTSGRNPTAVVEGPLRNGWPLQHDGQRRTLSLVALPVGDWLDGYTLQGTAADLFVAEDGTIGSGRTAGLRGSIDSDGRIRTLGLRVDGVGVDLTDRMAGVSLISGYRREVAERVPEIAGTSLEGCLLDDVVGSRFIAAFGLIVTHPTESIQEEKAPPIDTCAGWRAGGYAALHGPLGEAGRPNLLSAESVTSIFGTAWQEESPLPSGAMVRRRLLDVSKGDPVSVRSWFRDSLVRDRDEGSLHEYELTAQIIGGQVTSVDAIPRSLPHVDCPAAAPNAAVVLGTRVDDLDPTIRMHLHSVLGCTHLNDALRYLRIAQVL